MLPQITPATELGAAGVAAYAQRQGIDTTTFTTAFEPLQGIPFTDCGTASRG